jgi:hypothetical protein
MLTSSINEELQLIERLRKIETLFALSTAPADRQTSQSASERIRRRLAKMEESEPPIEFRFSLADSWSTSLFIALLRRYGLKPYRYTSQRRTTVDVKVARSFVDEVLWPEFQQVNATLRSHLDAVTNRIIREAIYGIDVEVEERNSTTP